MTVLDGLIGAMLVAIVASSVLFGILTVQAHSYFTRFPDDPRWIKIMVAVLWVVDCAHQVCTCLLVHEYTISHFGDFAFLGRNITPLCAAVTLEPIPGFIVQLYFARRLYLLNKKWLPVVIVILALALCAFGFGMGAGSIIYTLPMLQDFHHYTWLVTAWLSTCCACDILIAGAIATQLWTSRSGFKPTDKLLAQLTLWTVNTGALPAAFALFDIITFLSLNNSLVHLAFNIILAKLYTNTALAFLNRRASEKTYHRRYAGVFHMQTLDLSTVRERAASASLPSARNFVPEPPITFAIFTETHVDTHETDTLECSSPTVVDVKHDPFQRIPSTSPQRVAPIAFEESRTHVTDVEEPGR